MRARGIRTTLALLVVSCILPLALAVAFLTLNFYQNQHTQLVNSAIARARAMMSVIDRDFGVTQAALSALGSSPLLEKDDLRGFHQQAVAALANMRADSIAIVDAHGQLQLSTRRPFGEPLPKLVGMRLVKRILKTGEPGVSDVYLGPIVGGFAYAVGVPVQHQGREISVLNAVILPTQLARVLAAERFPDSWRVVIADGSGSIVARTHGIDQYLGKKVAPDLLTRMALADEASYETRTLEGIPILSAYSRSRETRWAVAIGIPLNEVTAPLEATLAWLIAVTVAALALGLALSWFIGGRIARSVTALTAPAKALGTGGAAAIPHLHFKEANALGRAIQAAAKALHTARFEAHHDVLTGLANRALFHLFVEQQLAQCRHRQTALAILFIDLDGFKSVNDTQGHAVGDLLLRAVAGRLKAAIRESDMAARLGGDEFAIALMDTDIQHAVPFAERLLGIISAAYALGTVEAGVSASIGIAAYPVSATDIDSLLQAADRAMYQAKVLGKRRVCVAPG